MLLWNRHVQAIRIYAKSGFNFKISFRAHIQAANIYCVRGLPNNSAYYCTYYVLILYYYNYLCNKRANAYGIRATRTLTIGGFRNRFIVVRFLFVRQPHRATRSSVALAAHGPRELPSRSQPSLLPPPPPPLAGGARSAGDRDQSSGVNRSVLCVVVVVVVARQPSRCYVRTRLVYTHITSNVCYTLSPPDFFLVNFSLRCCVFFVFNLDAIFFSKKFVFLRMFSVRMFGQCGPSLYVRDSRFYCYYNRCNRCNCSRGTARALVSFSRVCAFAQFLSGWLLFVCIVRREHLYVD